MSVVLDLEINSNEVLVFDKDSVELIEKAKLRDTMQMTSKFTGRPD